MRWYGASQTNRRRALGKQNSIHFTEAEETATLNLSVFFIFGVA